MLRDYTKNKYQLFIDTENNVCLTKYFNIRKDNREEEFKINLGLRFAGTMTHKNGFTYVNKSLIETILN